MNRRGGEKRGPARRLVVEVLLTVFNPDRRDGEGLLFGSRKVEAAL